MHMYMFGKKSNMAEIIYQEPDHILFRSELGNREKVRLLLSLFSCALLVQITFRPCQSAFV